MNPLIQTMHSALEATDPDLAQIVMRVAEDIDASSHMDATAQFVVQSGAMVAIGSMRQLTLLLDAALAAGLEAATFKEVIYQAVPYAGMGKALEALDILNSFLARNSLPMRHEGYATVTTSDRHAKGIALQKDIVGAETIDTMYATAPADLLHIQKLLSANCFGDHVARVGLSVPTRELLTLAILASLGGCEPQLKAHVAANARAGNGRAVLIDVMTHLLPLIGYPRTLNALRIIGEVLPPEPNSPATS
ncbi:carboxymuconolactone decarboxylase family protein [Luteibacter aegosomatissinici]|uniref:carboxymuconolactone decarboxylase family protein n=1 Tax=Luteibacter aegosomatissinici TaxID=2911539 RepID=UPI001FF7B178|nr:carboxymuconolactone decarboxylase family protein [Luteibacter aegosomatissinici]UPG93401.1 carboxymuconolactone decarboxylase family protein [Luteibacter aegosomatissinici]